VSRVNETGWSFQSGCESEKQSESEAELTEWFFRAGEMVRAELVLLFIKVIVSSRVVRR
jgi:hypothetical protein